ncbi:MAG: PD40 domain-containing protein [Planctomycetes bacterium]|nr:PD40 domain-containing protein [Planctomycetota bacterium]
MKTSTRLVLASASVILSLGSSGIAQSNGGGAPAWVEAEKGILEDHVQLTSEKRFKKAGESYFSPDGTQIIFQAVEHGTATQPEEPYYQMYVADLIYEGKRLVGSTNVRRLTPPGSASTCGWFHPTEPGVVVFGCTIVPPTDPGQAGYQRGSRRYVWQFPKEMDIVRVDLAKADGTAKTLERLVSNPDAYLAECVIRGDGRYLVYCEHIVGEGKNGGDLFVMDLQDGRRVPVTGQEGYDGGPFWSPDGTRICYRSDRQGNDLLQVFVAELAFDHAGNVLGVEREFQLTDNVHVNWAPYWHPAGKHLVYATSEVGHENYEVFVIDADSGMGGGPTKYGTRKRRITYADKFDGLPVFNADGSLMMWTSQRAADKSSQVWAARFVYPLEEREPVAEEAAPEKEPATKPERIQVEDPDSGLIYLYDPQIHELSVYNIETHEHQVVTDPDEIKKAMELFRKAGKGRR